MHIDVAHHHAPHALIISLVLSISIHLFWELHSGGIALPIMVLSCCATRAMCCATELTCYFIVYARCLDVETYKYVFVHPNKHAINMPLVIFYTYWSYRAGGCTMSYMSNDTMIPNLDTDTITYRFPVEIPGGYGKTRVYRIERSINGGKFHAIGTVQQTRKSTWTSSAMWRATNGNGTVFAADRTREDAVNQFERNLQPEYIERKRQEYIEAQAAEKTAREERTASLPQRLRIHAEHSSFTVVLDDYKVAEFIFQVHQGWGGGEPTYRPVLDKEFAVNQAMTLHDTIAKRIVNGDI